MMKCRLACRSTRNSILPPLMSRDGLGHVGGDRAGLRVRHQAARAEDAAEAADLAHHVRASRRRRRSRGSRRRPSRSARRDRRRRRRPHGRPRPCRRWRRRGPGRSCRCRSGRLTVPRTIWSALRGSTPRRMATSTVSSNFVLVLALANFMASAGRRACPGRTSPRPRGRSCCASCLVSFCVHVSNLVASCGTSQRRLLHGSRFSRVVEARQSATVTPMERAVPSTIFIAASMSLALRSGSLVVAISRTWSR